MKNSEADESGYEFFDRYLLMILRHKALYLIVAVVAAVSYASWMWWGEQACRTSWIMPAAKTSEIIVAFQYVGLPAPIIRGKSDDMIEVEVWTRDRACGWAVWAKAVTKLRQRRLIDEGRRVSDPSVEYSRIGLVRLAARSIIVMVVAPFLLAICIDTEERVRQHFLKLLRVSQQPKI